MINYDVPNNVFRVLVLIGMIATGYGFLEMEGAWRRYLNGIDSHNTRTDSITIKIIDLEFEVERNIIKASDEAGFFGIENPIVRQDSIITFSKTLMGDQLQVNATKAILPVWEEINSLQNEISKLKYKLKSEERTIARFHNSYNEETQTAFTVLLVGLFSVVLGIAGMSRFAEIDFRLKSTQLANSPKYHSRCQSCGVFFDSIATRALKADGNKHESYCRECYFDNEFTNPELTKEDVLIAIMNNPFLSKFKKVQLRRLIPKLERWKTHRYF